MRVNQIRTSHNVRFFDERMQRKFDLVPFSNTEEPAIVYGLYNTSDYEFIRIFKPVAIVLWRGTDALVLNEERANIIREKRNCIHYAASTNVRRSLGKWKINAEILPVTSTDLSIRCEPRGEWVYCYIGNFGLTMKRKYRIEILKWLQKRLPYKFAYTGFGQFNKEELLDIYRKSFVGIRLLSHDGMSNSILEMGMMGRRTVSNSHLPYTIRWQSPEGIRRAIIRQYEKRGSANQYISDAYRKLIDIGDKWLEI